MQTAGKPCTLSSPPTQAVHSPEATNRPALLTESVTAPKQPSLKQKTTNTLTRGHGLPCAGHIVASHRHPSTATTLHPHKPAPPGPTLT